MPYKHGKRVSKLYSSILMYNDTINYSIYILLY